MELKGFGVMHWNHIGCKRILTYKAGIIYRRQEMPTVSQNCRFLEALYTEKYSSCVGKVNIT